MKFILIKVNEPWGEMEVILNLKQIESIRYDCGPQYIQIRFEGRVIDGYINQEEFKRLKIFIEGSLSDDNGYHLQKEVFDLSIHDEGKFYGYPPGDEDEDESDEEESDDEEESEGS